MRTLKIHDALEVIFALIRKINKYLEIREPWKLVKDNKNVTHINFSKILLNDKNFDYENIWLEDQIHLNHYYHGNLLIRKISFY